MSQNNNRVVGRGFFDGEYQTSINVRVEGKLVNLWKCPIFTLWASMLNRTDNSGRYTKPKSYAIYCDTIVCEEWLLFSNFRKWYNAHFIEGYVLDKDLKNPFVSEYSPSNCMFIPQRVNAIFSGAKTKDDRLVGVYFNKERQKYQAQCSQGKGGNKYLGRFETELDGHRAWVYSKQKEILTISKLHTGELHGILMTWYNVLQHILDNNLGVSNLKDFVRKNPEVWKPINHPKVDLTKFLPKGI